MNGKTKANTIMKWKKTVRKETRNEEEDCRKRPLRRLMIYSYKCLAQRIVVVAINIIENWKKAWHSVVIITENRFI